MLSCKSNILKRKKEHFSARVRGDIERNSETKKMAHPNKRRKGKRRWSKLGFLVFYALFVAIAIGRKNSVFADSDESIYDSSLNPSNITIKLNMYSNLTGE